MLFFGKKQAAVEEAAQESMMLTPEEEQMALRRAERRKKIGSAIKKACIETTKGIIAGVVGVAVYRYMEQRSSGDSTTTDVEYNGTDAADLDTAYAEASAMNYNDAMEVV